MIHVAANLQDSLIALRMLLDLVIGGDPTLPPGHNELAPLAQLFSAIRDYVLFTLDEGDYLNDMLTHVPVIVRPILEAFGHLLAMLLAR